MKRYQIRIKNSVGMEIFSDEERALNGTNALLKIINKHNLVIEDGDTIIVEEF